MPPSAAECLTLRRPLPRPDRAFCTLLLASPRSLKNKKKKKKAAKEAAA